MRAVILGAKWKYASNFARASPKYSIENYNFRITHISINRQDVIPLLGLEV